MASGTVTPHEFVDLRRGKWQFKSNADNPQAVSEKSKKNDQVYWSVYKDWIEGYLTKCVIKESFGFTKLFVTVEDGEEALTAVLLFSSKAAQTLLVRLCNDDLRYNEKIRLEAKSIPYINNAGQTVNPNYCFVSQNGSAISAGVDRDSFPKAKQVTNAQGQPMMNGNYPVMDDSEVLAALTQIVENYIQPGIIQYEAEIQQKLREERYHRNDAPSAFEPGSGDWDVSDAHAQTEAMAAEYAQSQEQSTPADKAPVVSERPKTPPPSRPVDPREVPGTSSEMKLPNLSDIEVPQELKTKPNAAGANPPSVKASVNAYKQAGQHRPLVNRSSNSGPISGPAHTSLQNPPPISQNDEPAWMKGGHKSY